jgi:hypothetical protein
VIQELKEEYQETYARKRAELETSLKEGKIADPISILISIGISVAISAASYLVASAFAPKAAKRQEGKMTGSLQLMNSEQGIFIPEIYGAGPSITLTTGSNPTYQNLANVASLGGGGIAKVAGGTAWNAGASHNVAISSGQDAFFQITASVGHCTAGFTTDSSPTSGNTDFLFAVQFNPDGEVGIKFSGTGVIADLSTWVFGDVFRIELRSGRFRLFKNSAELVAPNFAPPAPSYPLYIGVSMYDVGAGISAGKVQIGSIGLAPNLGRGGIKVPGIIPWSTGIEKIVTTTQVPTQGGKGFGGQHGTQSIENISYQISIAFIFARGPLNLIREYGNADILIDQFVQSDNPSGVYDPTTGADTTYDPTLPPDPTVHYLKSFNRVDADIPFDGDGVGTGTIQGGGSSFVVYPGNATQQPDPTIEADIDGKYGAGSTPAYHNHAMIVHSGLSLSRWGGVMPNVTAVWEHQTLKTLNLIYASMCERVGVLAANSDYDFSGIAISCRGMLVAGRPYAPAEVIGSPDLQLAYNYFVTETEGQIVGYTEGTEPSITIPDTEIGWLDGDGDLPDILPEVDSIIAPEISLAREVHVKSLDPDSDWEPNTASAMRQITDGSAVELLEIQIAQLSDERRTTAQRKLYRDYVAGSAHKFTLSWQYLYLFPGYKITITRAEGFTHVMRLTSIDGGIGVLNCEGVALEPESFNQPANGVFPPGYIPPQPIPAMTVLTLLDTPLLRDGDETNNNGVGFYMCGTPRTGISQNWLGFALFISRNSVWSVIGSSNLPGTIGVIVSATGLNTTDPSVFDRTGHFIVDLYGTTATLSSVTEQDVKADATKNLAIFGDMVGQFVTATQVADFPNRWDISLLLNGRRGTERHVSDTFTGKRFVLVDGAVVFVPAVITDVNNLFSYRAVTNGQSFGDAATVTYTWTGRTLAPYGPVNIQGYRDTVSNLLIEWTRRGRIQGAMTVGSDVPLAEEEEKYEVDVMNGSTVVRTIRSDLSPIGFIPWQLYTPTTDVFFSLSTLKTAGSFVEFVMSAGGGPAIGNVTLRISGTNQPPGTSLYSIALNVPIATPSTFLIVDSFQPGGPTQYLETFAANTFASYKVRVVFTGDEALFYINYVNAASVPVFRAHTAPRTFDALTLAYTAFAGVGGVATLTNTAVKSGKPAAFYSLDSQIVDFSSFQNPLTVRVYQISATVGRGEYTETIV